MKTTINILYITILLIIVVAIGYSSMFLFETAGDSLRYSFGKTGLEYAKFNFFKSNGRWAQGLTNDYRLYKIRGIAAAFSLFLFLYGVYYLFNFLIKKKTESLVLTLSFYFSVVFSLIRFYPFTFNMCMVMSYTLGLGLLFLFIPLLFQYNASRSKIKLLFLVFIIVFTSGLLEIYGLTVLFTLACIIFYDFISYKKIVKSNIFLFILAFIFNAITYFSPGNINRRNLNDSSFGFDISTFTDIYTDVFTKVLNINTLAFFVIVFLIVFKNKSSVQKLDKNKFLTYIYGFLLTIIPLFLLVLAVKEKAVRFDRVHNISTVFTVLFFFIIAYGIALKLKGKLNEKLYNAILLLPLILFLVTYSLSTKNFKPKKVYTQIVTGDLKKFYDEEMARRDYLLSDNSIETVPTLSHKNFEGSVIGLVNEDRPNFSFHRSYKRIFSEGKDIEVKRNYPSPLVYSSIHFFEQGKSENLKILHKNDDIEVFYNTKYNTLLVYKKTSNFDYKITYNQGTLLSNWNLEQNKYAEYYNEHPDILSFKLNPEFLDTIDIQKEKSTEQITVSNMFTVNLKIKSKQEDKITLYYLTDNTYNKQQSITKKVNGNNSEQNIKFEIKLQQDFPLNLRLDYATKPNQEVEIKEFTIQNGNKNLTINQNQVKDYFNSPDQWNVDINTERAIFGVKKNNNRIDPKLLGNNKLRNTLKTLK